jgi:hypothetical protein
MGEDREMEDYTLSTQIDVTTRFGVVPTRPKRGDKVGISADTRSGKRRTLPLNGLRHPAGAGTSGWF